ncbi:hypothetical protein BpHYR1_052567 [Brachionus plicatilis]|uniref:Uncharacterized protein n=1 Tax=Brachionus plicatilis TaxID=10195 RepID=A0A3M7QU33_BRAPC|nr:hypothetical protein BpHYR1_052567 [Brachionus plicatilis]
MIIFFRNDTPLIDAMQALVTSNEQLLFVYPNQIRVPLKCELSISFDKMPIISPRLSYKLIPYSLMP